MNKIFMFLALVLTLCSCNETTSTTRAGDINQEFKMTCYGVVEGTMTVMYYRCENKEVVCYVSYNGTSVNCKWKGE